MVRMVFTVIEAPTGWFVKGTDLLGPFFTQERAMDLAEGMVVALRASGEEADLVVERRTWRASAPRGLMN